MLFSVKRLFREVFGKSLVVIVIMIASRRIVVSITVVLLMFQVIIWLHLKDKVSIFSVDIRCMEHARISFEASACFMPPSAVERFKIIAPVETELISILVPGEHFNVVV